MNERRRSLSVNGQDVVFWVMKADPLVKAPALIASTDRGGQVLQDPAEHEDVEEYDEAELEGLWAGGESRQGAGG